jgi:DNA-binding PadR family transcriptional regulator
MPPTPVDQLPLTIPVFQILLSLVDGPLHGYAIIRDVEARTGGEVRLTASTLYGAVARMLDGGLIDERESPEGQARRRVYAMSRRGKTLLADEARRLARAADWARDKHVLPASAPRLGGRR